MPAVAQMELNGMLLDLSRWQTLRAKLEGDRAALQGAVLARQIQEQAGEKRVSHLGATHFVGNGVMERDFYLSSQFSADPSDLADSTTCIYSKALPEN